MDMEEAPCPRCGDNAIAYDTAGACYVCQSCGFVPREQGFVSYDDTAAAHGEDQPQYHGAGSDGAHSGVVAAYASTTGGGVGGFGGGSGGGGGGGLALGPYSTRLAAAARSAADPGGAARQRRQRAQLDELGSLAAALRLPGPVTQLAAGFLARLHAGAAGDSSGQAAEQDADGAQPDADGADGADGPDGSGAAAAGVRRAPITGGSQAAARLGALCYLASRCEGGSLTLAEVAVATTIDLHRVGEIARQQAAYLRLSLPGVDVERFVVRMAMELAAGATATAGAAAAGDGEEGDAVGPPPPSAPPAVASEVSLRRHPLVTLAGRLAALAVRRGWHEGRTPRTVAGALLSISLDALHVPGAPGGGGGGGGGSGVPGGSLSATELARIAMCAPSALWELKHEVLRQLLLLARCLPFAPLLGPHNVAAYLELILEAEAGGLLDLMAAGAGPAGA